VIFDKHAHDLRVDRNGLLAEVDGWRVRWLVLADGVPRVIPDVLYRVPLGRVWVQNVADQVLGLLRQESWHLILGLDDLLVEFLSVLILKG